MSSPFEMQKDTIDDAQVRVVLDEAISKLPEDCPLRDTLMYMRDKDYLFVFINETTIDESAGSVMLNADISATANMMQSPRRLMTALFYALKVARDFFASAEMPDDHEYLVALSETSDRILEAIKSRSKVKIGNPAKLLN